MMEPPCNQIRAHVAPPDANRGCRRKAAHLLGVLGMVVMMRPATLEARTIELSAEVIDRMAVLTEEGPRQGWAAREINPGVFTSERLDLDNTRSVLLRYNLDVIPPQQRIAHAEWVIPIEHRRPTTGARLFIWRMLADWGPGAGHRYQRTLPDGPVAWALPGSRGNSSDRATRPTAVVRPTGADEQVVTVTEDVELWYSGIAANQGWMLAVEDPEVEIRMPTPLKLDSFQWILRVTYEPL